MMKRLQRTIILFASTALFFQLPIFGMGRPVGSKSNKEAWYAQFPLTNEVIRNENITDQKLINFLRSVESQDIDAIVNNAVNVDLTATEPFATAMQLVRRNRNVIQTLVTLRQVQEAAKKKGSMQVRRIG
jgi:hypothetical protein